MPQRRRLRNRRDGGGIDANDDDVVGRLAGREGAQEAPFTVEHHVLQPRPERRERGDQSRQRDRHDRDGLERSAAAIGFPHGLYLNARGRRC